MKQVLIKKGQAYVENVPSPSVRPGEVLVKVTYSLISTGTELSGVISSGASLTSQAKKQPEAVKIVLDMVKKQGLTRTYKIVKTMLEMGRPTGYSVAGQVMAIGDGVREFKPGDRVACAGAGKANHAEVVSVPKNLVVKIPETLSDQQAASVTLGSIALQGVRQADPRLGETVVVTGLGLLGLLTVQFLKASGCRVIGIDPDSKRRQAAEKFGAFLTLSSGQIETVMAATANVGADRVIITAATASDGPVDEAMKIVRKKGTVVVVGAVSMNIKRSPFYEKEVNFTISCSYGPGRYDPEYEEKGHDYPAAFVRWTENRNMAEYLRLLATGLVDFQAMIEGEYVIDEAGQAYEALKTSTDKPLAVLIKYPSHSSETPVLEIAPPRVKNLPRSAVRLAIIGAGGFATGMHLPNLEQLKNHYQLAAIVDRDGVVAKQIAERFGAKLASTSVEAVIKRPDVDAVMITTRHSNHASLAEEALRAGKHVFVEKPMALNSQELQRLTKTISKSGLVYTVGFNRRFSPMAKKLKTLITNRQNPFILTYRMNAGYLPLNHWTQTEEGGGQIIGQGCHIFDLFTYLAGSEPVELTSETINPTTGYYTHRDNLITTVKYADGSLASLMFTALGNKELSKEYLEVHWDGQSVVMDDYLTMKGYGVDADMTLTTQDKGHYQELVEFAEGVKNGQLPISLDDLVSTTNLTFLVG